MSGANAAYENSGDSPVSETSDDVGPRQSAPSAEPTMEEILASIRRIISDDSAGSEPEPQESPILKDEGDDRGEVVIDEQDASAVGPTGPEGQSSNFTEFVEQDAGFVFEESAASPESSADGPPLFNPFAHNDMSSENAVEVHAPVQMSVHAENPLEEDGADIASPAPAPATAADPVETLELQAEDVLAPDDSQANWIDNSNLVHEAAGEIGSSTALQSFDDSGVGSDPLLSEESNAAITDAFDKLATSMLAEREDEMGDMVERMMRPLLKDWLEDNLPTLVERIVRDEIERVSRGR